MTRGPLWCTHDERINLVDKTQTQIEGIKGDKTKITVVNLGKKEQSFPETPVVDRTRQTPRKDELRVFYQKPRARSSAIFKLVQGRIPTEK